MTKLIDLTLKAFSDAIASGDPTPGGGSASALSAANAAALACMYCNLTIGRKKFVEVEPKMRDALNELERARARLFELVDMDAQAFQQVMAGYALPKSTDEEKRIRKQAVEEGTIFAAKVPLEVCAWVVRILEVAGKIHKDGNPNALTDLSVGVQLAMAAFSGGALNVYINLDSIRDDTFVVSTKKTLRDYEEKARALSVEVATECYCRLGVEG